MTSIFQASSGFQGRAYEHLVADCLRSEGWTIIRCNAHEPITGTEIDVIARDPHGLLWWIECKGSSMSPRKQDGCRRSDTMKKAVADAWHLSTLPDRTPYMLVSSHPPVAGTQSDRLLRAALDAGIIHRFVVLRWATHR